MVLLGLAWVACTAFSAVVSVRAELPYDLRYVDRAGDKAHVGDDWLWRGGTALAAPLAAVAVVLLLSVVVGYGGTATRAASVLLVLAGLGSIAFTLANRATHDLLTRVHDEPLRTGCVIATLSLAGALVLFGVLTFGTTPRAARAHY